MFSHRDIKSYQIAMLIIFTCLFITGCGENESQETDDPDYSDANMALQDAEDAMQEAGLDVDLDDGMDEDTGDELSAILPDPLQIAQLEKQAQMEEAIDSFYVALDALGESGAAMAPARDPIIGNGAILNEELIRIHLYLSYAYTSAVVSQLTRAGFGPDGIFDTFDDLFYIDFHGEPSLARQKIYTFKLTARGLLLMKAVNEKTDPNGYIKVFYEQNQVDSLQAIINSLTLLVGAELVVIPSLADGIKLQTSNVNKKIYRHNALYHLDRAIELAKMTSQPLGIAIGRFDNTIIKYFSEDILNIAIDWGLEVKSIPQRYIHLLR